MIQNSFLQHPLTFELHLQSVATLTSLNDVPLLTSVDVVPLMKTTKVFEIYEHCIYYIGWMCPWNFLSMFYLVIYIYRERETFNDVMHKNFASCLLYVYYNKFSCFGLCKLRLLHQYVKDYVKKTEHADGETIYYIYIYNIYIYIYNILYERYLWNSFVFWKRITMFI